MKQNSPYYGKEIDEWYETTQKLIRNFPFDVNHFIKIVLFAWKDIFYSAFGKEEFKIGEDFFPTPQILGYFLHELIPLKLKKEFPTMWKKDKEVVEKDLVFIPDIKYSIEIKTSSSKNKIFGNRSYAQPSNNPKKDKSGYYLAVNFEKITKNNKNPKILLIRFGWLDYSDWLAQKSATGQQARLTLEADKYKLNVLYPKNNSRIDKF